jgi:hypothetical protein
MMNSAKTSFGAKLQSSRITTLVGPAAITLSLWLTSPNPVTFTQGIAAFVLLLAPWWSYGQWQKSGNRGLPLFAGVAIMYWLYFDMQLFWGDRSVLDWRHPGRQVGDTAITETMLLVVAGVISLWFGMASKLGRQMAPKRFPECSANASGIVYLQVVVAVATVAGMSNIPMLIAGEGFRQIVEILEGTVSMAAFVILLCRVLEGKSALFDRLFVVGVVVFRLVLGVSSGWMGSAVVLAMVCSLVYLHKRRKLPVIALAVVIPYVLFFQVGKTQFRNTFWYGQVEAGRLEKIEFWLSASLEKWRRAFDDPSGVQLRSLAATSLARTSLLNQAANVVEQTPSVVPYQYGSLYSYLAVALVPRFLWPDKPSMNEANRFYQVAYGLTPERRLDRISVAVGILTEGYINFGWYGSILAMFLVGLLLDFWNETFLCEGGGPSLAAGIGIALLPQLFVVESQLAQYVSGILQHVMLTLLVLLPVIKWRGGVTLRVIRRGTVGAAVIRS